MNTRWLCLLAASGMSMSQMSAVHAEVGELEEVIVTAQKRAERSVDVPMALTVLSSDDLEQRGIRSLQDISIAVPGLAMRADGPGSLQVFMRGIGNLAGAEALTSIYMDETPTTLYLWRQLDLRSLDVDHVEVLKGPQGTLYGQGSAAGTVRFITRKPVLDRFEGRAEAEMSFIDEGDSNEKMTGIFNVPLVDDVLAVRVAATGERGGGWIDQPERGIENGNNQDLYNVRTRVLWRPLDALEVNATVAVYRLESELGLDYESEDHTFAMSVDRSRRIRPRIDEYGLYNLTATYDFGSADLTSATSYIDYYRDYALPYIAPVESQFRPVGGNLEGVSTWDDRTYQFTQELRLVSTGERRFNYTVGAYYRDVSSDFSGPIVTLYNSVELAPFSYVFDNTSKSWSVFADGSVKIGERFEVGAGVRRFRDESQVIEGGFEQNDVFKSTDPRVYASYALNENVKLYANIAKGFRSGGFNGFGQPPYGPEKILNYEIGAKGIILDSRLSFDVAAYFTDYKDMIRRGLLIVDQQFQNVAANIGNVEIKGVEAGFGWRATDRLTFSASGSYIDAEVVEIAATNAANAVGDPADYVPELSYTLAGDYAFQWAAGIDGFVHLDLNHRDEVLYTDRFMYYPEFITQASDSFTLLGARIGVNWKRTSLELFANNLTNENKTVDPFFLWSQANRTKPRTIGLKAAFNF
jgi:iron complex outermembrane recepter protein